MSRINQQAIKELCRRHQQHQTPRGNRPAGAHHVPRGSYTGTVVEISRNPAAGPGSYLQAQLEIAHGAEVGKRITVKVGDTTAPARLLKNACANRAIIGFDVYRSQSGDGGWVSRVNRESLKLAASAANVSATEPATSAGMQLDRDTANADAIGDIPASHALSAGGPGAEPERFPTAEEICSAAGIFSTGFRCDGSKQARREFTNWHQALSSFAAGNECRDGSRAPAFLSKYCQSVDIVTYAEKHPEKVGSVRGYKGSVYGPIIDFDIDSRDGSGNPTPEVAVPKAIALLDTLTALQIPPDLIRVYFSGSKGFHISFPSMLAGALPGVELPAVEKCFCGMVAKRAGAEIDQTIYQTVHLLRAPNSVHEDSGLYKIPLTIEELRTLTLGEIRQLASRSRNMPLPGLVHEPVAAVADLWRQATTAARNGRQQPRGGSCGSSAGSDPPRIYSSTWQFLLNGAEEGERATELFKAAANLGDFDSRDDLVRALLHRGVELSGLPGSEAEGHINNALGRRDVPEPQHGD